MKLFNVAALLAICIASSMTMLGAEHGEVRMDGSKRVKPFSCLTVRNNEGCAPDREESAIWFSDSLEEAARSVEHLSKVKPDTVSDVEFLPMTKAEVSQLGSKVCSTASDGSFCDVRKASITFKDGHKNSNVYVFVPVGNIYSAVQGAFGPQKELYRFADLKISGFSIKP